MASVGRTLRTFFCECPMTSSVSLISRQWTGQIHANEIGLRAARTTDRILRPRGCKAGQRHGKVQFIRSIVNVFGHRQPNTVLNSDKLHTLSRIRVIFPK